MKFNKNDYIIHSSKMWNVSFDISNFPNYELEFKHGQIISDEPIKGNYGLLWFIKTDTDEQIYVYENDIEIDIIKTRDIKLNELFTNV
jgi:hypothetical protein